MAAGRIVLLFWVAQAALPHWPCIFSLGSGFYVATPAEIVERGLHRHLDFRRHFVTVITDAATALVHPVVVALCALGSGVVEVFKLGWQQWLKGYRLLSPQMASVEQASK